MAALWVLLLAATLYILATFHIVQAIYLELRSPLTKIPGPWYARFTQWGLKINVLLGRRLHYIDTMHHKYGRIVRIAPSEIAISDLDAFRQIHRIGGGFLKSPWYQKLNQAPEPGIFAMTDPRQHTARRKLFARAFSNASLREHWEPVVREKAEKAVARIRAEAEKGDVDILKWWTFMATDVIAQLSFGESFNMLEIGQKNRYIHTLEIALLGGGIRAELPWLHNLLSLLPIPSVQLIFRADDYLFEYGSKAIANFRKQRGGNRNIFTNIVAESDVNNDKQSLTDLGVRLEAGNLIVAGSDTTAVTLTYLVWLVLKRPSLQSRLEEEVAALGADFDDVKLETLPLLNSVINEALRLYGAAPGSLPRVVPTGGASLAGYFIPGGITVSTQAYTLHRDENIFPNPNTFNETRFLDPATLTDDQKAAFSPFGAGSRICIGLHLARMELRLATALFFRQCRGARVGDGMTEGMMEIENRFLIAPVGHRCDITLQQ